MPLAVIQDVDKEVEPLITGDFQVLAVLLAFLALLFLGASHPRVSKLFKVIPLLVFAYFVPTAMSNLDLIPRKMALYDVVLDVFLPASLFLMVLAVDLKAVLRLGKTALTLFLAATISIVVGGPLAYLLGLSLFPAELTAGTEPAWKGLAALSGSWIGGGANMAAVASSVELSMSSGLFGLMVVVDVAVANAWMFFLLLFAGKEREMDAALGARRGAIDEVRERVEGYEAKVARPSTLRDLMVLFALSIGGTVVAAALGEQIYDLTLGAAPAAGAEAARQDKPFLSAFAWTVILVTTFALLLSFTRTRSLEGAGASKLGSVFLYLLVATIGARADFSELNKGIGLLGVGAVWMLFHVGVMWFVRRWLKAPIFFLAVGSKANIGGAASAPIVASAFHPSLATVGVLLAVVGYVLGTYAALTCAYLLEMVHNFMV